MTTTYGQIESSLQAAIAGTVPDDGDHYVYVCDFSDTFVIYCLNWDEYLQDDYTMDDDGNVTLAGSPVPVKPLTTYVAVEQEAAARAAFESRGVVARAQIARAQERHTPQITIKSEPLTYHQHSPHSYFRDRLLTDRVAGAADRLRRHGEEMDVLAKERDELAWRRMRSAEFGYERRVEPNRTGGTGGYFSPPAWLNELFATAKRPGRVISSLIPGTFVLPSGVASINLPIISNGTTNDQMPDNNGVPDTDITDSAGSSLCVSFAGDADVALQLLEQSPQGAAIDWVLWTDLTESYDANLETQILYGLGTTAQQLPGVVPAASIAVTFTQATPTGALMYPYLGQAFAQIGDLRELPPEIWLMRSARWAWISTSESTAGLPFNLPTFFMGSDELTPDPIGGLINLPVFLDDAISATIGGSSPTNGTQDEIVCLRPSDLIFLEGAPQTGIMLEPGSGNLSARIQMHSYAACITRYTSGIAVINGTGMVVQSGF